MTKPFSYEEATAPQSGSFSYEDATGQAAKPSGAIRKLADKALGFASGAVGATKAIADAAGADNAASRALGDVNTGINDYLSPEAKADQQEQGAIMAEAKGKGTWEGVKAGAKAFAVAPVQTAVQGLGSIVPIIAGSVLTGGAVPAAAVGAGIGAAMGAGTAKGAIFDDIKKRSLAAGMNEADATAAATKAQEYTGANTDQIALGGALGTADALTGVSRIASNMVRGAIKKPVADALTTTTQHGILGRTARGIAAEMPLEAAQGGQEQLAANIAAQRAGYEAGTWDNVASNATLESLASAGPGAVFGAMDRAPAPPGQPAPATPADVPPAQPPLQISNTPDPFISFADGTVARQSEVDAYISGLPEAQQPAARAKIMGLAPQSAAQAGEIPQPVATVATPTASEAMGLNPAAGPISAAAVTAVDTGVTDGIKLQQASEADQAAYEQATAAQQQQAAEQDTADKPITTGPIADAQLSDEDKRAILFSNKTVADGGIQYEGTQDGDILNGLGKPYPTRFAAQRRARMEGKDWTIATVFDGFVARRKDANDSRTTDVSSVLPTTTGSRADQPGASLAPAVGATGTAGAAVDAGRAGDQPGREPVSSAGGVDATPVTKASNVQDPTPRADTPPAQARVETSPAVAGDAAAATGLPAATGPRVEGGGIAKIDDGAHKAATSPLNDLPQPTEAQKQAGNYPKGHVNLNGLDLAIENPAGSERSGTDKAGKAWTNTLQHHYGYIKGTVGNDKDHVDLFVKPGTPLDYSGQVFVIDQVHPDTGRFDEHKIVVGAQNGLEARRIYQANYAKGWKGFKAMTPMPFDQFKTWVKDGQKSKPLSGEKQVSQPQEQTSEKAPEAIEAAAQQQAPRTPATDQPAAGNDPAAAAEASAAPLKRGLERIRAAREAKKPKTSTPRARMEQARQARADYFTPGNIVTSYGGHDEVISYTPPKEDGSGWSVKVRAMAKQDGKWVPDPDNKRERVHSTQPDARELAKGPVEKAKPTPAADPMDAPSEQQVSDSLTAVDALTDDEAKAAAAHMGKKLTPRMDAKDALKQEHPDDIAHVLAGDSWNGKGWGKTAMPQSTGEFGPILTQFHHDAQGAIKALTELQDGEAVAALHHPEVGDIDLVWGKAPNESQEGYGLAKISIKHPEVLGDLQGFLNVLHKDAAHSGKNRIRLVNDAGDAVVSLDWKGEQKVWLLTAYKKGAEVSTTMDTADNGSKDDTARLEPSPDASIGQTTQEIKDTGPAQDGAQPAGILDAETSLWSRITDGAASVDEFKAGFERWVNSKADILAALSKNKKDDLLKMGGSMFAYRNKSETKPEIVEALWRDGANQYVLARSFSHGMGKNAWIDGVRNMVDKTDAEQLAQYAKDRKSAQEEAVARVAKTAEAIKDPKTLTDFQTWMRATMSTGKTFKEARLDLTPIQRAQYDDLAATASRAERSTRKEAQQDAILRAPGEAVTATEIIKTRHTKHGHDLWQFNLAQRVSGDEFKSLVAQAKRLGGDYSSYRGNGAIPGWQFRTEDAAKAFKALIAGDTTAAKDVMQERRDSFADDRSQSATERLNEMADRLDERADASLNQERKANTHKRASQAASAEAVANAEKAMAKTMRNIATAISDGKAKFLDRVRQKVQVEAMQGYVTTAHYDEMRAKYAGYADQEKHRGEAPTTETADFAEFPTFTAYRSDLATLARQLLEVDGTKLLGQRLLKGADDMSDAYTAFAKANFGKVSAFSSKGGGVASFGTRADADASIARSGFKGKAIAYQVKRGEHAVILSPSEAIERGIWQGDGDKRLTLPPDMGAELVEKIGKAARRGAKVSVPWQLETAHDRRKALARMGIETPAEFRAALREFIGLQEQAEAPSKVKQLERAMVGRKNDGLDFFPTPESVADEMVAAAGIEAGMAVLEPSAGMGHIAERIRAAGVDPDVIEIATDRRELLEVKGFNVVANNFTEMNQADLPDGAGYDRIIMNPPFSDGRDIQHVQHAYTLLKPGGRIVAIMGESAFTNQNKSATAFRDWLEQVGGTEEKMAEGSFNDPSLPVNTGANARMVVIDKATLQDGAMFSTRTSPPEKQLPLNQIERLVQSALRGVKNAPTVRVVASPESIGLTAPVDTVPSGVTLANGDIYVFQSGVGSVLEVDLVVFHEVFHKGLQNAMPRADYVAAMQDIARIDAKVRQYASEWSATNAGKDQLKELGKKYSGKELADQYEALATEEGLAKIAEDLKARREMGSKDIRVRRLVAWLAKVADKLGMTRLADRLRAMSYNDAEKFVIATIGRADGSTGGSVKFSASDAKPDAVRAGDVFRAPTGEAVTVMRALPGGKVEVRIQGKRLRLGEFKNNELKEWPKIGRADYSDGAYTTTQELIDLAKNEPSAPHSSDARLALQKLIELSKSSTNDNQTVEISRVTQDESKLLENEGIHVSPEFRHTADLYALRHTFKNHGDVKYETSRGQIPITEAEIKQIPEIIADPDAYILGAKSKIGRELIGYVKVLADGTSLYLEEVRTGKNSLAMVSIRKYPATKNASGAIQTVLLNVRNDSGNVRIVYPGPTSSQGARFRAADTLNAAANNATVNKVVDKLNEHFNHKGTLSFWDKTVGSPYHLAQRSPAFNKVFKAVQGFINGVSFYANEAADMAPTLLPKLENWRDIGKSPISTEDNKVIQAPIFHGTLSWARDESGKAVRIDALEAAAESLTVDQKAQRLLRGNHVSEGVMKMWRGLPVDQYESIIEGKYQSDMLKAGIVFTDAELTSLFNLTPKQIKLYREFHAATGKSLDNMGKAEMLRFGGKDVVQISDDVMNATSITEAAEMLRDHLMMAASFDPDRNDVLLEAANGMMERADKVTKLKAEGYAPLSRFGQYSVDVVVDGERQYFSLFETKHEANVMAAKMKMLYGAGNVQSGTVSQLEFQLLQGITPESLELFGNMLGLDSTGNEASDKAFQTYLKLTKNNRSAMKRMIHRKGITGYHEDAGRVLAAFVYSNARQTAAALHMGEITQSVSDIPQGEGQLKDAAVRLRDYVQNPKEEAQAMRGLLFAQYLGGSVASAFVNFTQPFTVSFPYLSQFGGAKRAAGALMQAMKDQKSGRYEPALAKALKQADEDGTTQPQAVHELMAQSRGAGTLKPGDGTRMGDATALGGNALAKMSLGWGKLFGLAEQINRRSTYIAAFRMAVENKVADPAAFAKKAVDETQFINNKGNKSRFARGAVGATLMTFKSYSINYLELLHRMATQNGPEGKKAAALMLGMLFLMAGAGGMPGADDLDDMVDFFAQRLGYNFSSSKARQEFMEDLFGKAGALFVERGMTGLPGSPIDVSGRMSMGNLIPGTGLLLKKRDHTRDATEILGAMGDMAQRVFKAGDQVLDGDIFKAVMTAAPKAVGNAYKGFDMASTGNYNDDKGAKVLGATPGEAAFKAIGFQPASVSQVQESNYLTQRAKDFYSLHAADIRARWARGIYEQDPSQVQAARDMIMDWNEKNPEQRMIANIPAIMQKVHKMRQTKEERIADTAPKAMRAQLRRDIAERAAQ